MTNLRIASYNLWFHRAYGEVAELVADENIDLICMQECSPNELQKNMGRLRLAGADQYVHRLPLKHRKTKKGITGASLQGDVGLALYYDPRKLRLEDVISFALPLPWQERKGGRIVQVGRFKTPSAEKLVVVNVHLSALLAPNRARRKQLQELLKRIDEYRAAAPVIVAGDFNYPIAERGLRRLMKTEGFAECGTHDSSPTHLSRLTKGKFDRIFISSDLSEQDYAVLSFGVSDHAPIAATIGLS